MPREAKGHVCFEVAPPQFLATLPLLHDLTLELDASAPGAAPADMLCALRAMLGCLPHCRGHGASGAAAGGARLRLRLRVAFPLSRPGLPAMGAGLLEQLLLELGLLPGLESLEVRTVWLFDC